MNPLVLLPLMIQAADLIGEPVPAYIPNVLLVSQEEIKTYCGNVKGCYINPVIRVREDLTEPEKTVVLFHEIVHHVQELSVVYNSPNLCEKQNYRELQAYGATNQFMFNNQIFKYIHYRPMPCYD